MSTDAESEEDKAFQGIVNCVNKGTVEVAHGSASANAAGGIAGTNSAKITNCVNEGTVEAKTGGQTEEKGTAALSVGGIVGAFTVTTKGEDGVIRGCKNTGTVTADVANAGGIAGEAYLGDPRYQAAIEQCQNEGTVLAANHYYAGIVADVGIKADNRMYQRE